MKQVPKNTSEDDVVQLLRHIDDNPASYDALIDNWNLVFDLGRQQGNDTFSKLEAAASATTPSISEAVSRPDSSVSRRVGHLLEHFDSPAYLVRKNGRISAQNSAATQSFHMGAGETLDDLPFKLEQGERISDLVRTSLNPGRNSQDAVIKRAFSDTSDSSATLSIAPSMAADGGESSALVFVINARWKTKATGLIKREFDLSTAEADLLVGFLDGQTTQDMAQARHRSHSTIRTQFHSLMGKMGARSQTELLRNALSVSQFVDQVEEIAEVIRHPHRKRVDMIRPGGRSVEITLAGDFKGTPLVFLQDAMSYTFEGKVEQVFHDAGYCIYSLCRPGFGDTDPPLAGDDDFKTFASDLDALLDQLGHDSCMLLTSNVGPSFMFAAAQQVSKRITGLIQVSASAPISYFQDRRTTSSWAQAVLNAAQKHGFLKELMIKTGIRTWKAIGQERFMQAQFRNATSGELAATTNPEALKESQFALNTATKQSLDPLVKTTLLVFSDYKPSIAATDIPILIIHGVNDSVFPIEGIRELAHDFDPRTKLIELEGAGFSAMSTHTQAIMEHISDFQEEIS